VVAVFKVSMSSFNSSSIQRDAHFVNEATGDLMKTTPTSSIQSVVQVHEQYTVPDRYATLHP